MTNLAKKFERILLRYQRQTIPETPPGLIAREAQQHCRPLAAPLSVQVEITDSCRQHCIFCRQSGRGTRLQGQGAVPIARLRSLARELAHLRVAEVVITGGEPGCHPDLPSVVATFKDAGLQVTLETSGADLPIRFIEDLRVILDPAYDAIRVSVDAATAKTYAAVRGVDAFEDLQRVMESLSSKGFRFTTATVITRDNRDELEAILRYAHTMGAVAASFGPPFDDGSAALPFALSTENLLDCYQMLLNLSEPIPLHLQMLHLAMQLLPDDGTEGPCCAAGLVSCAMNATGDIAFCHYMNDKHTATGTWEPGMLEELWQRIASERALAETLPHRSDLPLWERLCPAARRVSVPSAAR